MALRRLIAIFAAAIICTGCGGIVPPLDSPLPTATTEVNTPNVPPPTLPPLPTEVVATAIRSLLPTDTPAGPPTTTPTVTTTPTPGPSPTPDTNATSAAVFATITALAATPTYPPTSTPHPQRTPIGAGPETGDVPPTARLYSSGGITVQMLSQQAFPGGTATLTIKAQPEAVCTLSIDHSAGGRSRIEPIPGSATHTAGSDGGVAWLWTIDAHEPAGIMQLIVDCGQAGQARLQLNITQ